MSKDLSALDTELNQLILSGKTNEAMERFYDRDCVMQENTDEPCCGLGPNLEREKQFSAAVEQWFGAKLVSQGIGDGVTFGEWEFDVQMKGAPRSLMSQVSTRKWENGKIVHERFYHK